MANNNWRTIRKARLNPDEKTHWAYRLAWAAIGLAIGWVLGRGF